MEVLMLIFLLLKMQEKKRNNRLIYRYLRDNTDPFDEDPFVFRRRFRLPPHLAHEFIDELQVFDTDGTFSWIPFHVKVLTALNFYGQGSYQRGIGDNFKLIVSQSSVSRIVAYISRLITFRLASKYIKFPQTPQEKEIAAGSFEEEFGMQNTLGCIDGTHVCIIAPPQDALPRPRTYRNRKSRYSLNVEAVCDCKMRFLYINPRFPGSTHDSAIWAASPLRHYLKTSYQQGERYWILGDSGYPLEPWLLTPYGENSENSRYKRVFNRLHKKSRNLVERTFGVAKSIFRCLHKYRTLQYGPIRAAYIISSCITIYNFLKIRIDFDDVSYDDLDDSDDSDESDTGNEDQSDDFVRPHINVYREGCAVRDNYARSLV